MRAAVRLRAALPSAVLAAPILLLLALPAPAGAQETLDESHAVLQGGEPNTVRVLLNDVDVSGADGVARALRLDTSQPVRISLVLTPPENQTWEIAGFRLGILAAGPDRAPTYERTVESRNVIPPGFTVVLNRTADLASVDALGAGVFLMQASIVEADGSTLYAQPFYLRVEGNPFFTVAGAVVTVASVGTAYGLWRLFGDLREMHGAYKRHRREKAEAAAAAAEAGRDALARPAVKAVKTVRATLDERGRLERRPYLRWVLTGVGLGAVCLSWAQFLGYAAFDLVATLITALEVGGLFLGALLLVLALRRRFAPRPVPEVPTRTLIPEGPPSPTPPPDAPAAEVAPEAGPGRRAP